MANRYLADVNRTGCLTFFLTPFSKGSLLTEWSYLGWGNGGGNSVGAAFSLLVWSLSVQSVQSLSHVRLFATPWIASPPCPSPTPGVHTTHIHRLGDAIQPSHPLSSPSPPAPNPSQHQSLFQWVNSSHEVAKVLEFQYFSISPSNEYPGLISFRMDWLDLFAVQGTLKSLLQHHSAKASILRCSALFTVQLSHPYMTTGKTIALTRWTFAGKVMALLLNMLSRLVVTFLPRSKRLLISWLQSPSAVILEPRKIKSCTVSTLSPSISHEVMGPYAMILVFWILSFKPTFSLSSFTFIKRLFSSSSLSAIRVASSAIWGYWYFSQQSWFQVVFLPAQRSSWCTLHIS